MSNFTPLVTKTYEFDGDTVNVTFSRLKRKHVMELIPEFISAKAAVENAKDAEDIAIGSGVIEKFLELGDVIGEEYIKKVEGLTDSEGAPVEVNAIFSEFYFVQLANSIVLDLINETFPSKNG